MTVNEAREVLGVDASVAGQDLKRAYLRKVKAFPPDREPAQFDPSCVRTVELSRPLLTSTGSIAPPRHRQPASAPSEYCAKAADGAPRVSRCHASKLGSSL